MDKCRLQLTHYTVDFLGYSITPRQKWLSGCNLPVRCLLTCHSIFSAVVETQSGHHHIDDLDLDICPIPAIPEIARCLRARSGLWGSKSAAR